MADQKTELTVENFVELIKNMSERERGKIRAADLIKLILQLPDFSNITPSPGTDNQEINDKINGMVASIEYLRTQSTNNTAAIQNLNNDNIILKTQNGFLQNQVNDFQRPINNIEQYLRVDNVEVVGLPEPAEDLTDEDSLVDVFNQLDHGFTEPISSYDINISLVIPSRRRDGKRVVICKFMSRKSKIAVLEAKKYKKDLKYNNNLIFINEHLSPNNRKLFALASEKKHSLDYKYLWTKNGTIFMRKNDTAQAIIINDEEDIYNLPVDPTADENGV